MPVNSRDREAYRADEVKGHTMLSDQEKKRMLKVGLLYPRTLRQSY